MFDRICGVPCFKFTLSTCLVGGIKGVRIYPYIFFILLLMFDTNLEEGEVFKKVNDKP